MPINSSLYISGSVGVGGLNKRDDVTAVQQRLNDFMNPPRQKLAVDGLSGPKTARVIRDFQKSVMGFRRGDGRVDPDGKTIREAGIPQGFDGSRRKPVDRKNGAAQFAGKALPVVVAAWDIYDAVQEYMADTKSLQ